MKNLLIYTGPRKQFDTEHEKLARIQIDNSLDLGWKKDDILIYTDFPFEYNGVKAIQIDDGIYYDFDLGASKIAVIAYLLQHKLLDQTQLYWCHDFDAFELNKMTEAELGLATFDLGLTHYTYKPEWMCGSLFFTTSARDVLELLHNTILTRRYKSRNNEKNLTWLIKQQVIDTRRYKRLNVTYNIMKRCLRTIYNLADKPLKVLHFLPSNKDALMPDTALDMFMYGKNSLHIPLMTPRLTNIFHSHGIK